MESYKIRNNILDYIYEYQRKYVELEKKGFQDSPFSHVGLKELERDLKLSEKQVKTNVRWLQFQGEIEYIEFEEDIWGYGLTKRGTARISEPYTGSTESDRKLKRRLSNSSLIKNWVGIVALIIPFIVQLFGKIFADFNFFNWLGSIF